MGNCPKVHINDASLNYIVGEPLVGSVLWRNRLFSSPNLEKKLLLHAILLHLTISVALRFTHSNDS